MARRQSRQGRRGRRLLLSAHRRSATPRRNISPRIFRARCSSISTPSPTPRPICRTCCPGRISSARRWARSASPTPTPSWSMTPPGFIRRRACGGPSASSAPRTSTCSTAACRPGRRKAARAKPARSNGRLPSSRRRWTPARWPWSPTCRWRSTTAAPRWSTRARPDRFAAARPIRGPGLRAGHMPGALNVPFADILENGRLASREKIAAGLRQGRRRSRQADDHHLRLRRHRRGAGARPRCARQAAAAHL